MTQENKHECLYRHKQENIFLTSHCNTYFCSFIDFFSPYTIITNQIWQKSVRGCSWVLNGVTNLFIDCWAVRSLPGQLILLYIPISYYFIFNFYFLLLLLFIFLFLSIYNYFYFLLFIFHFLIPLYIFYYCLLFIFLLYIIRKSYLWLENHFLKNCFPLKIFNKFFFKYNVSCTDGKISVRIIYFLLPIFLLSSAH